MRTAFVTGATGQDGSYLIDSLREDGIEVHALVRAEVMPGEQPLGPGVHAHQGDLADLEGTARIVETIAPDLIVNLAGLTSVAQSWVDPVRASLISGHAVVGLLESARLLTSAGRDVRFVQASSSEIFGAASEVPQRETTPIRPVSPYGAAKALAHEMVGIYRTRGVHASAAILYNHESPRRPTAFVTRKITLGVARIARGLQEKLVLGNLDARRDWGWAPDYVEALRLMAKADRPGDYVIATGQAHSVRDFVDAAFRAAGITEWHHLVDVDERFIRPSDAPLMQGDSSLARQHLGWTPSIDFSEIVRRMVEADLATVETA